MGRCGSAIAALAMSIGALTACGGGGDGGVGEGARPALPPTVTADAPHGERTPLPEEDRRGGDDVLRGRTIVIDPGHNGGNARAPERINRQVDIGNGRKTCDTTGTATNAGYSEHAFTWDVSQRLRRLLQQRGAKVILTRSDDKGVGPCIDERAAIGNENDADAVISVHADGSSATGHGFHIIEPAPVPGVTTEEYVEESHKLALAIRDAYRAGTGMPYSNYLGREGIDRRNDLGGLNLSKVPKVFIETGNMRHAGDAAKLSNAQFRQRIAESLAEGLQKYLRG
ncbi:N-acetylmuramoyl-L-alanine amidase [uncultured Thermomonospora sp.]|uniref:N-acetylmuramoyl-L-alanine amidase n=1 Tax=uncultured Thermomonospora sp. TaxID=671175 RepID=UPI00259BDC9E|nr:N-acetylmuramoyl-L-alanine amidase [uncultured Thermomonospora sp.]